MMGRVEEPLRTREGNPRLEGFLRNFSKTAPELAPTNLREQGAGVRP